MYLITLYKTYIHGQNRSVINVENIDILGCCELRPRLEPYGCILRQT